MLDDFPNADGSATRRRPHRGRRIVAVAVAAVLLLAVGAVAGYLGFLNHTVSSNTKHAELLPAPVPHESGGAGQDQQRDTPKRSKAAGDAQNILLLGSDSRGAVGNGRADVIVLAHIADDRQSVQLIHFPRDLYVDIPGHGKNKINAAFAYGGSPLLVRTLQQLIHVPIDHVALIGFNGFKRMTNAVGGVDVYAEEASSERTVIHKGMNHLNGEEALQFVRERHQLSEGDISRGRRQQAFIKALMLKGLSKHVLTNPVTLAHFVDAATSNLTVDQKLSVGDMRSLAFSLRGIRGNDITFLTAPWSGFDMTAQGASIVVMDNQGMQELSNALRNDTLLAYARNHRE